MAWVVRACGVLRDVCWACWLRARSREPAVARRDARPVRRHPDAEPYDDFRPSRWRHGGILQSSGRSEALPATPTLPDRGARARQFPISRSERWAPPAATPPPVLFGAGVGGHPGVPDWRPLGVCPYRRQCAECSPSKFIGGLSWTVMGSAPSVGVVASVPSTVSAADSVPSPVDSPSLAIVSSLGVSTASLEGSSDWMTSSSGRSSVAASVGASSIVAASPVLTASSIAGC